MRMYIEGVEVRKGSIPKSYFHLGLKILMWLEKKYFNSEKEVLDWLKDIDYDDIQINELKENINQLIK